MITRLRDIFVGLFFGFIAVNTSETLGIPEFLGFVFALLMLTVYLHLDEALIKKYGRNNTK